MFEVNDLVFRKCLTKFSQNFFRTGHWGERAFLAFDAADLLAKATQLSDKKNLAK